MTVNDTIYSLTKQPNTQSPNNPAGATARTAIREEYPSTAQCTPHSIVSSASRNVLLAKPCYDVPSRAIGRRTGTPWNAALMEPLFFRFKIV